jgi:hypothetical protein
MNSTWGPAPRLNTIKISIFTSLDNMSKIMSGRILFVSNRLIDHTQKAASAQFGPEARNDLDPMTKIHHKTLTVLFGQKSGIFSQELSSANRPKLGSAITG